MRRPLCVHHIVPWEMWIGVRLAIFYTFYCVRLTGSLTDAGWPPGRCFTMHINIQSRKIDLITIEHWANSECGSTAAAAVATAADWLIAFRTRSGDGCSEIKSLQTYGQSVNWIKLVRSTEQDNFFSFTETKAIIRHFFLLLFPVAITRSLTENSCKLKNVTAHLPIIWTTIMLHLFAKVVLSNIATPFHARNAAQCIEMKIRLRRAHEILTLLAYVIRRIQWIHLLHANSDSRNE